MEWFSHNYEYINNNEGIREQNIPSFSDVENNIRKNYENNSEKEGSKELALRQLKEQQQLKEQKENPILQESKEWLDKEAMINEAKTMLYEKLWINDNLWSNNWWENFWKWLVDTLILDNYELAIQVWETNWKVIIDWIKQLFSSWDNIKKVAEALWESVMWLFSLDWYQTWKSIAELWLIWGWVWAWVYVWKKTVKLWMKQISKLRKSAERVVESSSVKKVIWETTSRVDEIVPKQEINVEDLAKRRFDIERQVRWLENLWIPESVSKSLLESGLLTLFVWTKPLDLLERYKALNKKWVDYDLMIDDVLEKIPNLTIDEALLIFTYTDNILYRKINRFMRWDKELLKGMSPENIEASNQLVSRLTTALEKMPDMEWDLVFRWDDWIWWRWNIWDEITLDSFTSVSNNTNDIFSWDKINTIITVEWKKGRVKDISSLALIPNFWDKFPQIPKTINEWVILPNSKVVVKEIKEAEHKWRKINDVTVTQVE